MQMIEVDPSTDERAAAGMGGLLGALRNEMPPSERREFDAFVRRLEEAQQAPKGGGK